jgi:hypothetical protein
MSQVEDTRSAYSFATVRYLVDPKRGIDLPVGIVLWNQADHWLRFRGPKENERINGVPGATVRSHLESAQAQIEGWLRRGELPYATERLAPLSDAWWDHVRRLMQFSVRIGPVQPVDCRHPEEEIETLFEALVQPQVPPRERAERVDGALKRALGPVLAQRFRRRQKVAGFHGRPVEVLRLAADGRHAVIVEAVNLAANTAEKDADAMASRLSRIKRNEVGLQPSFVLGYLASPSGLNGEAALKEWIEQEVDVPMYDLARDQEAFQKAARRAIDTLDPSHDLFPAEQPSEPEVSRAVGQSR